MLEGYNINNFISDIPSSGIKLDGKFVDDLKNFYQSTNMNYLNKEDYRNKLNKLYDDVGGIKPIDSEINNIIYFEDYDEKGIVVDFKISLLKQIWVDYRLIYNEKSESGEDMEKSFVLDNFDEIFDRLSRRVDGVDKYIDELNYMRKEIDNTSLSLNSDRENLALEKVNFEEYKKQELERLELMEKELSEKMAKVDSLLKTMESKMDNIFK